jgi:xanthine phosphoribosyltransferase
MQALKQRILAEGRNLGGGILKIDSILNHQLDPGLMRDMGRELAGRFAGVAIDRVLTAEISGIAPALMTGLALGVPVVFARKRTPVTMSGQVFVETAPSHTKGGEVSLSVSAEFLRAGENVLIVDDFLATGETLFALARLVKSAGAKLAGVGVVVEKTFEGGRRRMREAGYGDVRIESLAAISSMDNGRIVFADGV